MPRSHAAEPVETRLAMRRLMKQRGIPLDKPEIAPRRVSPVEIRQNAARLSNTLFKADSATECCLWIEVVSRSALPLVIKHVGLEVPFVQEQFAWLEVPVRVSKQQVYRLPFSGDFFARPDVINHRLLREKLLPGVPIQGFLLGTIRQALPEKLKGEIIAKIRILDREGREACQSVSLYIDTRVFRRRETKPTARRQLALGSSKRLG